MDTAPHQELKRREGLTVWREGDGAVIKRSWTAEETERLKREEVFLKTLAESGFTPQVLGTQEHDDGGYRLILEDLGDGEEVKQPWLFMLNACGLLRALDAHHIHHGDLTILNIIVRNDIPFAIDFGEARWYGEDRPSKRPNVDAYHLWPAIAARIGVNSQ